VSRKAQKTVHNPGPASEPFVLPHERDCELTVNGLAQRDVGVKQRLSFQAPIPVQYAIFHSRPLGRRWLCYALGDGVFTQIIPRHHSAKREVYVWHQSVCSNVFVTLIDLPGSDNLLASGLLNEDLQEISTEFEID